jgi:hypothetical protein
MRRPKPRAKKVRPASERLSAQALQRLAGRAEYVGSPHHKDIPTFGLTPAPRSGATSIEDANARRTDNPDCTLCPRKWVSRRQDATNLLREAIRSGYVSEDAEVDSLPIHVWARDPEDPNLVYEARRLSWPENGYKAYPLTQKQAEALPLNLP